MTTGQFKDKLKELGISQPKAAKLLGMGESAFKMQLSRADDVTPEMERIVTNRHIEKGKPSQTVTSVQDPYEIMPDGYARGYPNDTPFMRSYFRTPAAWMRLTCKDDQPCPELRDGRLFKIVGGKRVFV